MTSMHDLPISNILFVGFPCEKSSSSTLQLDLHKKIVLQPERKICKQLSNSLSLRVITKWICAIPLTRNQHPCQLKVILENGLEINEIGNQLSHGRTCFV